MKADSQGDGGITSTNIFEPGEFFNTIYCGRPKCPAFSKEPWAR